MHEEAIRRLADGERHELTRLGHSGDRLESLLNELGELGLPYERDGEALRIPGGIELLNSDEILVALSPASRELVSELEIHWTIDSTNSHLMARQMREPCHGCACFAEQQTKGKGRRGKEWVSPFARNVYLSLAWQMSTGGAPLDGLSLAVGVSVADALRGCGVEGVQLKWPNDLLFEAAKLGGILVEMSGPREGHAGIVVGVGLNVGMPMAAAGEIDQEWTDLARATGRSVSRNEVAASVLNSLAEMLDSFPASGFRAFHGRWQELDAWRDRMVTLHMGDRSVVGREAGVDDRGALQLVTEEGLTRFTGGEISLRPA